MSRPVVSVFIAQSLDGYIAAEDGSLDWLLQAGSPDEDYGFNEFISHVDLIAMGRATYDFIKDVEDLPYGNRPIHVFTSREIAPREGFEFYEKSAENALRDWESQGVKRVYVDGGNLISQFLAIGAVDDFTITTVPILLGAGIPLFPRINVTMELELIRVQSFPSGMAQSVYQRK